MRLRKEGFQTWWRWDASISQNLLYLFKFLRFLFIFKWVPFQTTTGSGSMLSLKIRNFAQKTVLTPKNTPQLLGERHEYLWRYLAMIGVLWNMSNKYIFTLLKSEWTYYRHHSSQRLFHPEQSSSQQRDGDFSTAEELLEQVPTISFVAIKSRLLRSAG